LAGAQGDVQYSLENSPLQLESTFETLASGSYLLFAEDAEGCTYDTLVTIFPGNSIEITTVDTLLLLEGDTVALEASVSYSGQDIFYNWSSEDPLSCYDCPNPILSAFADQLVTVSLTDDNGCMVESYIRVLVDEKADMWIANMFAAGAENDVNKEISLYSASFVSKINDFSIYNRWGNKIYTFTDVDPKTTTITWDGTTNGRFVDSGIYILVVEYELTTGERKSYIRDVGFFR